ncbi:MAG: nuclear transport factor 2 family protein [Myxococcota bacterium]
MDCASCKRANRVGARFCSGCGSPLGLRCPACGVKCELDAQFCDGCGVSLVAPASPEAGAARKVVTILFADLVGSTSLQERLDAESTRRVMERYYAAMRAPVEAHRGAVVQLLGDGVMCAFGVPHVAEDDAIRAVRAAVAMQQAFRQFAREEGAVVGSLGLRIAVNTGEVVVSDERPHGIGDPLNVAGRLQQEAREGDVLVGEATRRLVGEQVTLEHFGTFALRGRAEPVPAYRVVSLERPAGAPAIAFVGREDDLRRLTALYDAAVARPAPQLATILGSPGLGKSRLLDEFARRLGGRATVLTARCDSAGGATFAPLAGALRALLPGDDPPVGDALRPDEPDRARIAAGIAALLAGSPASTEETFFVVRRFLAALAAVRPVVLAIDDVQWAEPLLLDLTEHLVQWSAGVPLLVLVAARPELRDTRLSLTTPGGLVSAVVTLGGLDAGAAARLAANVVGADELPAALAGRVLATSEGNPLFVGELVRMLVQDGALKRDGDRWTTGVALADIEMPPTIHALLAARIERLRPEERTVLERAAVVGRHFSRAAVSALLPRELSDLDARLESLRRSELIEPDTGWFLGEPVLRFHHALIRDAAYRRVLRGTRAELHGRFADWIVSRVGDSVEHDETIGWHLEQAHQHLRELGPLDARGRDLGERAAKYLAAAGRRALARDDLPVAANLLGRALERLEPTDPARAELTLDRCESLLAAGDVTPAAAAIADLARFAAGSDRLQAWHTCFAGQLAALTDPQSLHATASAVAAAAQSLAAAGDTAGEAKAHSVHALALQRLGKVGACEAALDLALAAARRVRDRRRSNAVLAGAPLAALWGPSPVTRASGRCLDVVRVLRITQGAPAVEAVALRCQAVLEALRGRTDAARRMLASSRRMVEELGLTPQLLETDVFSGLIDLLEGDPVAAERCLRGAYEGLREHGLGIDAARAAALLARALLAQGRVSEGEALSEASESLAGDDLQAAISWRGARAQALVRRGEHALAVDFARAAVEIAAATDALLHHADARSSLATALRAAGRSAEADTEERRAIELWEAKGATLLAERARRSAEPRAALPSASAEPAARVPPRVRPNAATALVTRLDAIVRARDAEGLSRLLSDSLSIVHHPTRTELGAEGGLNMLAMLLRAENLSFRNELLATLGDSLVLCHTHNSITALGDDDVAPFGAIDGDLVALMEVDGSGRQRRAELFAVDRLGDAVARLYELHAESLPDGPVRTRAAATARSVAAVLGVAGDPAAFRAALAPHLEFVDHRQLGFGKSRGADAVRRDNLVLYDVSEEIQTPVDALLALRADGLVAQRTFRGVDRASGGPFERDLLELWCFGANGLLEHLEHFDPADASSALARFEELAAESAPARVLPRVRPNAATANAARMDAAVEARDFEAFRSLLRDDAEAVYHPTGTRYEESRALEGYRVIVETEGASLRHEPLASQGDSLALSRVSLSIPSGSEDSFIASHGAVDSDSFLVTQVDTVGLRRLSEFFATDRLGDAIVRLYELYAESLPEGEARNAGERVARSMRAMFDAPELERLAEAFGPGIELVDRSSLGMWSARGMAAALEHFRTLAEVASNVAFREYEILRLEPRAALVRRTHSGIDRANGGAYETRLVLLMLFGGDGLLVRVEWFDADREAEASARIDALTARVEAPQRRVRPNAATANAVRLDAAAAARDFAAFKDQFAADAQVVHHPTETTFEESRNFPDYERLLQAPALEFANRPIATLGDSLALFRASMWIGATPLDIGETANEWLLLTEVDAAGRRRHTEFFAADRLGDATARLYERHAESLPEGAARVRAAATARSVSRWLKSFDDFEHYVVPEAEFVDHRPLGFGSLHGVELVRRATRAQLELARDIVFRVDDVQALRSDAFLVRSVTSGVDRASGGAYERPLLIIGIFGAEGLATRVEWFEPEREGEALARFDALTAESPKRARRLRPNAATANAARLQAAISARDAGAFPALFTENAKSVHHPTGAVYERSGVLESLALILEAEDAVFRSEPLATLGESHALCRSSLSHGGLTSGDFAPFGASETDLVVLIEVDAHGARTSAEFFAPDHLAEAVVRLYERYAESLAAGPARERALVTARTASSLAFPFEVERHAQSFGPSVAFADHRPLGMGTVLGVEGLARWLGSLRETAGDLVFRIDDILALRPDQLLVTTTSAGTLRAGGGAFEQRSAQLYVVGPDGRVASVEWFDIEQLDDALARSDALAAESSALERRVRSNAATANAARLDAAVAARDVDAFLPFIRDDLVSVHHPTGTTYDREGAVVRLRAALRAEQLMWVRQPLAALGDSLALCRLVASSIGQSGRHFDVGAARHEMIELIEVDALGRRGRLETFADHHLGDALIRLYERYAELQPEGPARDGAAVFARATRAMFEAPNLERLAQVFAPSIELVDHRSLGTWSARGADAALQHFRSLLELAGDIEMREYDVLAVEPAASLVRRTHRGIDRASGGSYERRFITLKACGSDGRLTRLEWFDADREAEALARFAAVTAEPRTARFSNAATRTVERMERAWAERDWPAVAAMSAPGFRMDDRRAVVGLPLAGQDFQVNLRRMFDMPASRWLLAPMATRGESFALFHSRLTGEARGGGPVEFEHLSLVELDPGGQYLALVVFDAEDVDGAYAELDRRYVAGEGAPWAELIAHQRALAQAAVTHDEAALERLLPADFTAFNRQRFGGTGERTSRERFIAFSRALADLDVRGNFRLDHLLRISATAAVAAMTWHGTRDGGAFEVLQCVVCTHDGHRLHSWEILDLDQLDQAYARYDELTAEQVTPSIENAATRAMVRGQEAVRGGDWERFSALFRPDFRNSDRRRMVLLELDLAQFLEFLHSFLMRQQTTFELVATRGTRLAMLRFRWAMSEDGSAGPSEGDFLTIAEVDEAGAIAAQVFFDADSLDAAYAELDLRYAAGEAASFAGVWDALQQRTRAHASRDWERLADLLPADLVTEDHRPVRWGSLRSRDEYLARVRALVELAPDVTLRFEHVLGFDERRALFVLRWTGTREGGAFEIPLVSVSVLDAEGTTRALHLFDLEQLGEARALYDALQRSPSAPRIENGATRSLERLRQAWMARDWDGVAASLAPGFRQIDRRPMMQLDLDRDQFLAFMREVYDMSSSRLESEVLATRGARLAVARVRFEGADDSIGFTEIDSLALIEADEHGNRSAMVRFEADDVDGAYRELDLRYAAIDPDYERLNEFTTAADRRDWDAVAALVAPDFVMDDHRPLGWETLHGPQAWIDTMRALVELAPDVRLRIDHFARTGLASLIVSTWVGTRDGGAFEDPKVVVSELGPDGRFRRMSQYDLAQLDAARARYEDLGREASGARSENAATRAVYELDAALEAYDSERVAARYAADYRHFDRRRMMHFELDRDGQLELLRVTSKTSYVRFVREVLAVRGERLALTRVQCQMTDRGSGASDLEWLSVTEVDDAGAFAATVMMDPDDLDAAHAELERRFAALERSESSNPLHIPPNTASRASERIEQSRATEDWDAVRALCAPAMVFDDRRSVALVTGDRELFVSKLRVSVANRARVALTLLATAGDRLSLHRLRSSGASEDAAAWETENLCATEVDAEGRVTAVVILDADDRRSASIEMFERYFRAEGALHTPASSMEIVRGLNGRDLGRIRAALGDDFYFHDHRRTGLGRIGKADEYVASVAAIYEQSPDACTDTLYHVAVERHGSLSVGRLFGALRDGGPFESVFVRLNLFRESRLVATELFELEDLALARARFAALRPSR